MWFRNRKHVIGCSHDAGFACRTNKCWIEFLKIIDYRSSIYSDSYFSRRTAKMQNILMLRGIITHVCIVYCTVRCIVYCTVRCIVYCTVRCIVYCTVRCIVYCTVRCIVYCTVRCVLCSSCTLQQY